MNTGRKSSYRALLASGIGLMAGPLAAHAQENGLVINLDTVQIESESNDILKQDGYVARQDRIGTKVDTPIAEIPQAVSVVTEDQIEDQEPRTLNEALTYTASANTGNFGFDSRFDAFTLRGFNAYYNGLFRDGLRQYNSPTGLYKTEPYGLEGITILKGPASSLYGVSGPGGIVNLVTKRPKDVPFHEIELIYGEDQRYQANFDATGPANASGTILYRVTGVARKSDTWLEGYPDDKYYIAPALAFRPDGDTSLTILGELSRSVTGGTAAFYNPSYGQVSDIYNGDPRYNDFTQEQGRIGYEFEHRFSDLLTVRQNLRYSHVDADLEYSGLYDAGAPDLARYWGHYQEDVSTFVVDNMAQFTFDTGPVAHTAVAGLDYTWASYDGAQALDYVSLDAIRNADLAYDGGQDTNQTGVYLHDQMEWNNFNLFLSGRYDWVDTTSHATDYSETGQKDEAFSGRAGLSYRTEWGIIPYANYSSSFSPNIGNVYDDLNSSVSRTADPTIAEQVEVGVKYEIPDANAVLTADYFHITQQDGVVFDASTGINKQRQLDLTSKGVEFEARTSLDNGLSLIASYTHMEMTIDAGAAGTVGKELSGVPNDIAAIWGHYDFQPGSRLAGLGIGAGVRYVGTSFGDDLNTIDNSDRYFVDAALSYDFGALDPDFDGVKLQVNAKNLFDEQKAICTSGYCYRDEGRKVIGSLRYRF
ncbi:TonB-dependent siderophore receptor [Aurantimonas sp. VKM B-3413]|uniref:TonB-dependent siderophore receptor n=1 Tax=Aurantimonas sp. VKM B-3413 TaxID=2779401 RepID=UPI001E4DB877|nr:TonB-dependent siderophore receptor [Aurantimonas sp. VKM B-3413]MCB8839248.1 TonB-dependent siderophore receptor [Aurantimonas sp. VKM B-3413]